MVDVSPPTSLLACPTWEISARMIPRYCLPCPRASMSAKNSFLSWISFTTGQGEGPSVYRAMGLQGPGRGRGTGLASPEERMQSRGQCFSLFGPQGSPLSPILGPLHTLSPPLHNRPIDDLRSSNRSSSDAGSSWRTGGGFLFRSFLSFPVAKIFWSLCFSFSRSPVKAQKWLHYGVNGTPIRGLCP